jgi:raffinose/stachyose/melibiose transport system substrate-binding protein
VTTRWRTLALFGVLVLTLGACSGGGASTAPSAAAPSAAASAAAPSAGAPSAEPSAAAAPVDIDWWHIAINDPGKKDFQAIADAYMADHPNVKINITALENEAFKAKLQTTMQGDDIPDLFQSWGGGMMAAQADAGKLQDITTTMAPWASTINPGALSIYNYNGKQYGVPWDVGIMGMWYNKALFAKAGITAPPTTWDEFLADVDKLQAAGITPYALAGKDKWPGMHLWSYLVLRIGGAEQLQQMVQSGNWNTDVCKQAGAEVQKLVAKKPFQKGFLNAAYDKGEAAAMGNGDTAVELMGQWAPSVQVANSTSKEGIGDDLAWFPFPTVAGGAGNATDAIGGGNGIAVGKDAPPEALDFLKFFNDISNAEMIGKDAFGLPTTVGSETSVADPNLKAVLDARGQATFVQLYLDQAASPSVGAAINDATAGLFAGTSTPEQTCQALTDAAAAG